jgi:hypothetical protein
MYLLKTLRHQMNERLQGAVLRARVEELLLADDLRKELVVKIRQLQNELKKMKWAKRIESAAPKIWVKMSHSRGRHSTQGR